MDIKRYNSIFERITKDIILCKRQIMDNKGINYMHKTDNNKTRQNI